MSVNFYDVNPIDELATFTFTSMNQTLASYIYDNNYNTKLYSSGSDDVTDEVLEIEFQTSKTFNRAFLANHNIKSGELEYWTGSAYASFSTPASLSNNTEDYNYFEFNAVSTTKIRLTINTTQTANAEKFIGQLRVMNELGETGTDPKDVTFTFKSKDAQHELGTGGVVQVKFGTKYRGKFSFTDADNTDVELFETLKNRSKPFYVYPGGGDSSISQYGFRIKDMFLVNYINDFEPKVKGNIFGIGTEIRLDLYEV